MANNTPIRADTRQNRIQSFAFVIAVSVSVCLSVYFVSLSTVGAGESCEMELQSRINPNNAPPASLVRLSGIGISRANAIITYREDFSKKEANKLAFVNPDDLQKVKGIGPKTAENISQWLKFE